MTRTDGMERPRTGVFRLVLLGSPILLALALASILTGEPEDQWVGPSLMHPLGTDEFGRDLLASAVWATGASVLKGLAVTVFSLTAATLAAELVTLRQTSAVSAMVRIAAGIVESIPIVLWVLIAVIAIQGPRIVVAALAFAVIVFPIATNVIAGEFLRLRRAFYVEAAYLLGAGEVRVALRHILPNAAAILAPFGLQVLGAAIAVDGAIGVIGLGNRSDLDLGIFLLRGKESFELHPQVLIVALALYGLVYAYIAWIGFALSRAMRGAAAEAWEGALRESPA